MLSSEREVVILEHKFAPDGGNIYDAILDPSIVSKLLSATLTRTIVRTKIDARVGCRYSLVERRDGKDVLHTGQFLELIRPSHIVFTLLVPEYSNEQSTVRIDIAPAGEGCDLTLTHTGLFAEFVERAREGWEAILNTAESLLE